MDEVEIIKGNAEVRRALDETTGRKVPPPAKPKTQDKIWLGTHALLLAGLAAFYYMLGLPWFAFAQNYVPLLQRLTRGATLIVLVLATAKIIDVYLIGRIASAVVRYNLRRIEHLLLATLVGFIAVSVIFVNWYAAVVSLGVISIIIGFALQTTLSSFIGWET